MDVCLTKTTMMIFILSLMGCTQANPVLKNPTNGDGQTDSNLVPTPLIPSTDAIEKDNLDPITNTNNGANENSNIVETDNTMTNVQQGQLLPTDQPFQDSLALSSTVETGEDAADGQVDDVSKDFTRKVLRAFFAELKNRPDLVDEILRRETYKVLMSSGLGGNYYNALAPGSELAQELDGLAPEIERQIGSDGNEDKVDTEENSISKKNIQNIQTGSLDALSKENQGDISVNNSPKLQAALAKELESGDDLTALTDKAPALGGNDQVDVSGEYLQDPYYYYVYYDDVEDPNSGSTVENGDTQSTPKPDNAEDNKSKVINNNNDNKDDESENKMAEIPSEINDAAKLHYDTHVAKLATALKSVVARDMESQLSKSKMALNGGNNKAMKDVAGMSADMKIVPHVVTGVNDKTLPEDEEMQLTKLTE